MLYCAYEYITYEKYLYSQSGNARTFHNSIGFIRVSDALVDDLLGTLLLPALDHKIKTIRLLYSLTDYS